jgi:hypothetical protein
MTNFKTVKDLMQHEEILGSMGYCLEALTCYDCEIWNECPYSFDAYNTDGECLANK